MSEVEMPTTKTRAVDLTPEQIAFGRRRLPSLSVTFVEHHAPEAVVLARHYLSARDKFLHAPAGGLGEGYAFDPKLYAKACHTLDVLLEHIPEHLQTGTHPLKVEA